MEPGTLQVALQPSNEQEQAAMAHLNEACKQPFQCSCRTNKAFVDIACLRLHTSCCSTLCHQWLGCWLEPGFDSSSDSTGAEAAAAVRGQPSRLQHCPQRSFLIMDTLPKPEALAAKVPPFKQA